MPSLARGFERLVALARDPATRAANLRVDHISRDWTRSLGAVVDRLADHFTADTASCVNTHERLSRSA